MVRLAPLPRLDTQFIECTVTVAIIDRDKSVLGKSMEETPREIHKINKSIGRGVEFLFSNNNNSDDNNNKNNRTIELSPKREAETQTLVVVFVVLFLSPS